MNHIDHFRAAIEAAGLTPPGDILDDGKLHRFSSNGRKTDDSGWYVLHGDNIPAGRFGCYRGGIDRKWRADVRREFSEEERAAYRKRMDDAKRQREQDARESAARAAEKAASLWAKSEPGEHPYLTRKQIMCAGARVLGSLLLVPMRHKPGPLVGLQCIDPSGERNYLSGTPAEGAYTVIGTPATAGPVVICEGYATGVSIHMATRHAVVVAFSAGNLLPVAQKIRKALPDADLILAADDDYLTAGNPGLSSARTAAIAIGARLAIPHWPENRPEKATDFNDLHISHGLDYVASLFLDALPAAADPDPAPVVDLSADPEPVIQTSQPTEYPEEPPHRADDAETFIYASTPMKTAELFAAHERDVVFWRGDFYSWAGHRYISRDPDYMRSKLYHFMASCLTIQQDKQGNREVTAFNPKRSSVDDALHALKGVCYIDLADAPEWIETRPGDPPATEIVAFKNGFLHWPTRALRPSDPRLFVVSALDFDYDPAAPAPIEWQRFLSGLWPDDPESTQALADMFGYLLTDDTRQQKAFMLIGPPRSGKGTILRVLENMIGPHNRVSPSLASLGTQYGMQPLIGKRAALISDARLSGRTDQQPIVENLLRVTGEDSVSIQRKYLSDWTGKLPTRFVLASNELPAFSDASAALANRFVLFRFTNSFLGKEDQGLTGRLMRELPGIVLWALDGLERLMDRGYLIEPASAKELADELRESSSPISQFVADRCRLNPVATVERVTLFNAWKQFCEEQGRDHPGTLISFGRQLGAAVAGIGRSQPRTDGTRLSVYTGICLKGAMDRDDSPL